jgi:hypothetical protein
MASLRLSWSGRIFAHPSAVAIVRVSAVDTVATTGNLAVETIGLPANQSANLGGANLVFCPPACHFYCHFLCVSRKCAPHQKTLATGTYHRSDLLNGPVTGWLASAAHSHLMAAEIPRSLRLVAPQKPDDPDHVPNIYA